MQVNAMKTRKVCAEGIMLCPGKKETINIVTYVGNICTGRFLWSDSQVVR